MIKRIDKYLIENYPLIWNTKIVWMVLILLGAHAIFYIAGFFSYNEPKDLNTYSLFYKYFRNGAIWIGILFSILSFILWLNKYFKQNAFKSFYPKTNCSLYMEFVWIFIICFMNISFYISYTEGLRQRISNSITMAELEREVDIVNKGEVFTLRNSYLYNERCVPVSVFDSLVSEEEVLRLYVKNQVEHSYADEWRNVNPANYLWYKDRLPQPYYTNVEFTVLLAAHFPNRVPVGIGQKHLNTTKESDIEEVVITEPLYDNYYGYTTEGLNSLYNYCYLPVAFHSDKDREYYAQHRADLLQNEKKAEIETILNDYLALADKYEISYRFEDAKWIDYVYNPPYYFIDYDLSRDTDYDYYNDGYKKIDHIGYELAYCMDNLVESKSNVISLESVLILLYLALFFSILIYTFRMTSLRIWLMSFVGAIVVMFIYGATIAFGFVIGRGGSETWMMSRILVFILIFWAITFYCLKIGKGKKTAGMFLNFGILTLPAILPLLTFIYQDKLSYKHPHYEWISDHVAELFTINIGAFFLLLLLVVPVIKKWKSLPEE